MAHLTWMHLTDLHCRAQQDQLWSSIQNSLHDDLSRLHPQTGPVDLLLFTGDLVATGTDAEFGEITRILHNLLEHLDKLGSHPKIVTVPGNHDVNRPPTSDAALVGMRTWFSDANIRTQFVSDDRSVYREFVRNAFVSYSRWLDTAPLPFLSPEEHGQLIPGDHRYRYRKQDLTLGIVGLNSAFLQLESGAFEERLDITEEQFHKLYSKSYSSEAWLADKSFCFLMTHHPPSWLERRSRARFSQVIAPPGRFLVHLCGHLHDTDHNSMSIGGGDIRLLHQGFSLSSQVKRADGSIQRKCGYSLGRIERHGAAGAWVGRVWPRVYRVAEDGSGRFVPEHEYFSLDDNGSAELRLPSTSGPNTFINVLREQASLGEGRAELQSKQPHNIELPALPELFPGLGSSGLHKSLDVTAISAHNLDKLAVVDRIDADHECQVLAPVSMCPGGSGANTSYVLASLGLKVAIAGIVGQDTAGLALRDSLNQAGVDTNLLITPSRQSGFAGTSSTGKTVTCVDQAGGRFIVVIPGVNNEFATEVGSRPKYCSDLYDSLNRSRVVHMSSFAGRAELVMQRDMAARLRSDTLLSFNPGAIYSKIGFKGVSTFLRLASVVFFYHEQLQAVCNGGASIGGGSSGAGSSTQELLVKYFELRSQLRPSCRQVVVVKQRVMMSGANLVAPFVVAGVGEDKLDRYIVATCDRNGSEIRDTTGAGDAAAGGFIAGLLGGSSWQSCVNSAYACAVIASSQVGARTAFRDREVRVHIAGT